MMDLMKQSPLGVYVEHCRKGELAYQVCTDDDTPVFFPRAVAPKTGSGNLEWRVSKGLGTVYSTTVVHGGKDVPPHNVALIDIDEGYRMMSRVEGIDPMQVKIGMRVKVKINPGDDKQLPYPVFTPLTPDLSPGGREESQAFLLPSGEGSGMRDGKGTK